jgi:hypothetical protein
MFLNIFEKCAKKYVILVYSTWRVRQNYHFLFVLFLVALPCWTNWPMCFCVKNKLYHCIPQLFSHPLSCACNSGWITHCFARGRNHWTLLGQKSLEFIFLLFTVTSTKGFYSPPLSKSGLKLVCNVSIAYGNITSDLKIRLCPETSTKLYVHKFGFWNSITE